MGYKTQHRIYRADLKQNRKTLYVFGDNNERTGFGGQAKEMRGEPNAIGVRTKMKASHTSGSYMTDEELPSNLEKIFVDFMPIVSHLHQGGDVVFPTDGLGTGLAELSTRAPKTLEFLRVFEDYCRANFS